MYSRLPYAGLSCVQGRSVITSGSNAHGLAAMCNSVQGPASELQNPPFFDSSNFTLRVYGAIAKIESFREPALQWD